MTIPHITLSENFIYSIFSNKKEKMENIVINLDKELQEAFEKSNYAFIDNFFSYSVNKVSHLFSKHEDIYSNSNISDIFFKMQSIYKKKLQKKWFDNLSTEDKNFFDFLQVDTYDYINYMYPSNGITTPYSYIIGQLLWNGTFKIEYEDLKKYQKDFDIAQQNIQKYTSKW